LHKKFLSQKNHWTREKSKSIIRLQVNFQTPILAGKRSQKFQKKKLNKERGDAFEREKSFVV
jgi:hypothetical protein